MHANYETYSTLQVIIDSGNRDTFRDMPMKAIAKFLRTAFKSGTDSFILSDPVLSRLNFRKIKLMPLAACLSCGGDQNTLDLFCSDYLTIS